MSFKKSLQLSRQFCIQISREICTKSTKTIINTPVYQLQYGTLKVIKNFSIVSLIFFKVAIAFASSIYFGSFLAKTGATALEENEIFVHSDEDDDD